LLEDPELSELEKYDALAPLYHIEGIDRHICFQRTAVITVQSDVLHATRSPGKRGGARGKEPSGLRWPHGLIFLDAPVCRVLVAGVVAIDNRERRGDGDLLLSRDIVHRPIQAARPLADRPDAAGLRYFHLWLWKVFPLMLECWPGL